MDSIYKLRNQWDSLYNPLFTKLIGAVLVFFGFNFIIATGPFADQLGMIISVVLAILYCYSPGVAAFTFACLFFVCTAHINFIFSILIAGMGLAFCALNYMQTALFILTPACMAFAGGFEYFYWCIFVLFIFFTARSGKNGTNICYAIYYTLLLFMMGKFGFGDMIYEDSVEWIKTDIVELSEFFNSVDPETGFAYLMEENLTNAFLILCVFLIVCQALHILFSKKSLFLKIANADGRDGALFAIAAVVLICMNLAFVYGFGFECGEHYFAMVVQCLFAYLISRPFCSVTVLHTFKTKTQLAEDTAGNHSVSAVVVKDSWDTIAGYENTKAEIREVIKAYVDKEEQKKLQKANMKPIKGLLLFGPPGTGKTTIARAIANETNMKLIVVNAGEFVDKYVGESEKRLRAIFEEAKKNAPAMICFDEIESFLAKRNDDTRNYEKNIITTFLSQMDGFNEMKDVFVVATTNKPNLIDEAALRPGRFDKIIFVGAPDGVARKALFRKYLDKKANLDLIDMDRLVDLTDRYTGADIKGICEEAYRRNNYMPLTEDDIVSQVKQIRPSFTLDMKDEYNLWSKKYNRSSISEQDYKQKKKNSLTWDDIKGMDELKDILRKKIENPIKNMEKYRQFNIPVSKGILFFGPPGCGKTFFAKVVADECETAFFTINGPELLSGGMGESERNLRKVFRDAREAKPAIIFFDEIDAIAQRRELSSGNVRLINQLLTEMDGMESLDGVIVIAATNRPQILDTALLRAGRFDTKIYIGMPDQPSKAEMLRASLADIPTALNIDSCVEKLENYSCADITAVANKVKEFFVQRSILEGDDLPVSMADFEEIVKSTKASIPAEEVAEYEKMKELQSIM